MSTKQSVDWTVIVRELLQHYTQMQLKEKTGVHQGTISEINRGIPKPRLTYESGVALLNAYNEIKEHNQCVTNQ